MRKNKPPPAGGFRCFVGGLSKEWKDDALSRAFEEYKPVKVKVVQDAFTGQAKGFGFVTFTDESTMLKAIEGMNGVDVEGRKLVVYKAEQEGGPGALPPSPSASSKVRGFFSMGSAASKTTVESKTTGSKSLPVSKSLNIQAFSSPNPSAEGPKRKQKESDGPSSKKNQSESEKKTGGKFNLFPASMTHK